MQSLIKSFGLDWKLFLAQAFNFLVVLVVLRLTVYKPLLGFLAERRTKIEEGIAKSEEADRRLHEANELKKTKMKEAEAEVVKVMKSAEDRAEEEAKKILDGAEKKRIEAMKLARELIEVERTTERKKLYAEAVDLVKKTIVKTVEISPAEIDEKLIEKVTKEQIAI